MTIRKQWQRRLLTVEIVSLLILVASLFLVGRGTPDQEPVSPGWLLIPAIASLTMFLSFLGLMYLRWNASAATNSRQRIQNLLFVLLTVTLLSIWAMAILETWRSLSGATS